MEFLKKNNPGLTDVDRIHIGQRIVFPPLSGSDSALSYTVYVASFQPFSPARDLFQKLVRKGYEAYIIPFYDARKGKVFRVTVGNFKDSVEAQKFAAMMLEKGVSTSAEPIQVEMK